MGVSALADFAEAALAAGADPDLPVAIVESGHTDAQRTTRATLATAAAEAAAAGGAQSRGHRVRPCRRRRPAAAVPGVETRRVTLPCEHRRFHRSRDGCGTLCTRDLGRPRGLHDPAARRSALRRAHRRPGAARRRGAPRAGAHDRAAHRRRGAHRAIARAHRRAARHRRGHDRRRVPRAGSRRSDEAGLLEELLDRHPARPDRRPRAEGARRDPAGGPHRRLGGRVGDGGRARGVPARRGRRRQADRRAAPRLRRRRARRGVRGRGGRRRQSDHLPLGSAARPRGRATFRASRHPPASTTRSSSPRRRAPRSGSALPRSCRCCRRCARMPRPGRLLMAAVGPITAGPLRAAGFEPLIPDRGRLGSLVRAVVTHFGGGQAPGNRRRRRAGSSCAAPASCWTAGTSPCRGWDWTSSPRSSTRTAAIVSREELQGALPRSVSNHARRRGRGRARARGASACPT